MSNTRRHAHTHTHCVYYNHRYSTVKPHPNRKESPRIELPSTQTASLSLTHTSSMCVCVCVFSSLKALVQYVEFFTHKCNPAQSSTMMQHGGRSNVLVLGWLLCQSKGKSKWISLVLNWWKFWLLSYYSQKLFEISVVCSGISAGCSIETYS